MFCKELRIHSCANTTFKKRQMVANRFKCCSQSTFVLETDCTLYIHLQDSGRTGTSSTCELDAGEEFRVNARGLTLYREWINGDISPSDC